MNIPAGYTISSVTFPLSCDHLLTLVQYNVLRAGIANRLSLDAIPALNSRLHATFAPTDYHVFPALSPFEALNLPYPLHPTVLQSTVLHPHWIDIIPHPRMRDNLIRALGTFDASKLWYDTVGGLFKGFQDDEPRGLVTWTTPWHWAGWELSTGFLREWGWVAEGCEEMVMASDVWRERRGEGRIEGVVGL
jgi:hypothetical protein